MHSKVPVVLVHGAFSTSKVFFEMAEWLRTCGHVVYDMDLPGHRQGDSNPVGCTIDLYANAVADAVHEIEREYGPVALVGHSMGGLIAEYVARDNPDIAALILLASAPPYESFMNPAAQLVLATYLPLRATRQTLSLSDVDFRQFFLNDLSAESEIERRLQQFVPESWPSIFEMAFHGRAMKPERLLTKHVSVLAAKQDRVMALRSQEHIARRFNTVLTVIDAGHMSLLWNFETCLALSSFLEGVPTIERSSVAAAAAE